MKQVICYQCELCGAYYEKEDEASACEKTGTITSLVKKGDEVTLQLETYFHRHQLRRARVLNVQQVGHNWEYQLGILSKKTKSVESIHIYLHEELKERLAKF